MVLLSWVSLSTQGDGIRPVYAAKFIPGSAGRSQGLTIREQFVNI
jgi:hypothetical protein